MYQVKLQSFPNREVRATLTKVRDRILPRASIGSGEGVLEPLIDSSDPLDISFKLETPPNPPRRVSRFGLNARRTLMRIGGALQEFDPVPEHHLFFTGTLPGSTHRAMAAISAESSWVVHRLKAWIGKRLQSKFDFYVWELQKRGALHLHYCLYCPDAQLRAYFIEHFHGQWCRLMDGVGERQSTNVYQKGFGDGRSTRREVVQAYCQEVRSSVCGYMAKYCSKGDSKNEARWEKYFPKRWWGCSRPLLALLRSRSSEVVIQITALSSAEALLSKMGDELESLAVKLHRYRHRVGLGRSLVGFFLGGLWRVAKKKMADQFGLHGSGDRGAFKSPSYLEEALGRATALVLGCRSSCPAFGFGESPLLADRVAWFASHGQLHTPDTLRQWYVAFMGLTSTVTFMRVARYLSPDSAETYRILLRSFWRIRDSRSDSGRWDFDKCYELSRILYSERPEKYRSTTDTESGRGTLKADALQTRGASVSSPLQLELKLDDVSRLAGDRRGRGS